MPKHLSSRRGCRTSQNQTSASVCTAAMRTSKKCQAAPTILLLARVLVAVLLLLALSKTGAAGASTLGPGRGQWETANPSDVGLSAKLLAAASKRVVEQTPER